MGTSLGFIVRASVSQGDGFHSNQQQQKSWEPDQPGPELCSSSDEWNHVCHKGSALLLLLTHCCFSPGEKWAVKHSVSRHALSPASSRPTTLQLNARVRNGSDRKGAGRVAFPPPKVGVTRTLPYPIRHHSGDCSVALAWANKEVETFVCILGEEDVVYDVYVAAAAIDIRPTTKGTVGSGNATSELSWAISPPPYRTFAIRSVPHPAVEKRHYSPSPPKSTEKHPELKQDP
ncbi:unnamed protein product [Boreogadus saida]